MKHVWQSVHWRHLLWIVVGLAVVLRILLIVNAPAYGYVWDFYQEGVARLYATGHLPASTACWQCYHPPLFYWLGWPFYALGMKLSPADETVAWRLLAAESLLSVGALVYYGVRLMRLVGCRGTSLAAGVMLLLSTPILFIASDGPDADTLVAALLCGFAFHATRIFGRSRPITTLDAIGLGILAGLAIATKFSGLTAVVSAGLLIGLRLYQGGDRPATLRAGAIVVLLALAIGGWKYLDNERRYGTALFANGSAADGFGVGTRAPGAAYEFTSLRLRDLSRLYGRGAPAGELTEFPVYRSVLTSLHAQVWSDMSLFSVRGRHGSPDRPYSTRRIPVFITMSVVTLGLVPEMLAVLGVIVSLRHRLLRPVLVFAAVTLAAYVWWFLPQARWALKAKYLLALAPVAVVFALVGQAWINRHVPAVAALTMSLLVMLGLAAHVYMFVFAVAR